MTVVVLTLFVAVGWNLVCPTEGFLPNKIIEMGARALSFSFEDAVNHQEMTRNAHLQVAAEVLRDNPNSGSYQRLSAVSNLDEESLITAYFGQVDRDRINAFKSAVEVVQDANSDVDFGPEKDLAAAHFDSEQLQSGQDRLIQLCQNVTSSILNGHYDKARRDTGRIFHTLQDFYSHTNWIENGNRAPYRVLGRPNEKIENVASPSQQTCTDCSKKGYLLTYYECKDNIIPSLKQNRILTSGYASDQTYNTGQEIEKPSGKCSHGGLFVDSTRDTFARGGINKDGPYHRTSPHHYLHHEAAAVAQQATVDMFHDIRSDVNNDLLFGMYLGVFTDNAAVKSIHTSKGIKAKSSLLLQHYVKKIKGKSLMLFIA